MHLAVLLWGFTGILGRVITLSAPVLVWYRMGLTALFIGIILSYRKLWQKLERKDVKKVVGIGLLYAIHWVAFYASIKLANASIALVCLSTASVFTAVLDPILNKKKINPLEIGLSLIAILGVYCIYVMYPAEDELKPDKKAMLDFPLGLALGILASVISAIFTVFNKPLAGKYEPRLLVFYEMMIGFIFLTIVAPLYIYQNPAEPLIPFNWDIIWIFCLVYFCTVLGQSLAMTALKDLSTFTVTFSVNLEPVYGIILAFIFFDEQEQLSAGFYIGMGLIALSVLLQVSLLIRNSRKQKVLV
ncbi:EamA family transporter [Taibaiella sp. KBW10]|nr:EamA family transporter [Taibaiella sp. KBW10]